MSLSYILREDKIAFASYVHGRLPFILERLESEQDALHNSLTVKQLRSGLGFAIVTEEQAQEAQASFNGFLESQKVLRELMDGLTAAVDELVKSQEVDLDALASELSLAAKQKSIRFNPLLTKRYPLILANLDKTTT